MANYFLKREKISRLEFVHIPGGMYPSTFYKVFKPTKGNIVFATAGLFDMATQQNIQSIKDEGKMTGYYSSKNVIGIKGDKELVFTDYMKAIHDPTIRDFMGGSPMILNNYKIEVDWGNLKSSYLRGRHRRMIIGFSPQNVVFCATDSALYVEEAGIVAKRLLYLQHALCGDGGLWSPHLQVNGKVIRRGYRKSVTYVYAIFEGGDANAK